MFQMYFNLFPIATLLLLIILSLLTLKFVKDIHSYNSRLRLKLSLTLIEHH